MKRAIYFTSLLVLLSVFFVNAQQALAQGTDLGTIAGSVTDSSGAVVANADVTITDLATGAARAAKSNTQGEYRVFGLRSGGYKVTVKAAGMGTAVLTGIRLNGSDVVTADAVLKVASTTEAVEVTSEVPLVNTEDQTISDNISSQAVIDLPRDSRDVYTFLYLNPNITQAGSDGAFKFLGAQSYGANFSLDGQRSNGGIFGEHTASQPSLEAVGEINVLSNDFSAEYAGIANIRITTKRGGSGYHGSMFYNNKNSALAAWTLQDQIGKAEFAPTAFQSQYPNPYFNYNDIGGAIGGPIPLLKKTWFYAAYERNYVVAPVNLRNNNLPHPSLSAGDFSRVDPENQPLLTPEQFSRFTPAEQAGATQVCNPDDPTDCAFRVSTIPSRLLNPTVQTLISKYFPQIGTSAPIDGEWPCARLPDVAFGRFDAGPRYPAGRP